MTIAPADLFGPSVVGTTPAALYTVPASTTVTVNRIVFNNVSGSAVGLTVWVVRSGGSVLAGNLMIGSNGAGLSISAGPSEPYVANALASLVLNAGDAIWAQASVATALNGLGSGWTQ